MTHFKVIISFLNPTNLDYFKQYIELKHLHRIYRREKVTLLDN